MKQIYFIGIVVAIAIILFVISLLSMQIDEASPFEMESSTISAKCAKLQSVDSCHGTITVGSTTGECYWNNYCKGRNFQQKKWTQNENGNFVLYVSNQSFAINPVDIEIYIDEKQAIYEYFDVGFFMFAQHNQKKFQFQLEKGTHKIRAISRRGEAELEKEFEIVDKHWALVDYWFYPEGTKGASPTPKHFSFSITNYPISFA